MKSSENWQVLLAAIPAPNTKPSLDLKVHICPLDYQAIFAINGADCEKFLQGQLTCDMREVSIKGSSLAAHCNPKGSMLSTMRVITFNNGYLLKTNTENFEQSILLLNKYMMFSKAQSTDLSGEWVGFGIYGEQAYAFLDTEFTGIPHTENQVVEFENSLIIKIPGQRYEVWMSFAEAKLWLAKTQVQQALLSSQYWHKQDIVNAIADIYPASSGEYIPQMCNFQAIGAVSFQKGCYTGQEIITRLHFRGKLNKQLVIAKFKTTSSSTPPAIGQSVINDQQKKIGKVLQSCITDDDCYLQIIVNHKDVEQQMFLDNNIELQAIPLPYTLDEALFIRKS